MNNIEKIQKYFSFLRSLFVIPHYPNLIGDRDIEWSWIAAKIFSGEKNVLDFGAGNSNLGLIAAMCGHRVYCLDINKFDRHYHHENLHFIQGDLNFFFDNYDMKFDLILNCSVIEHTGLEGRYSIDIENRNEDIEIMVKLNMLLTPHGKMLLTIPVGKDAVYPPLHRVYGKKRLPLLLKDYLVCEEQFWSKDDNNKWITVDKESALSFNSYSISQYVNQNAYALGCFVLKRK